MNSLDRQFYGFYNTSSLFEEIDDINQFEFEDVVFDEKVLDISIEKRVRLGVRVEYFFEYYINKTKRYKLLYKNTQIIENKDTLGEIDFILFDKKFDKYLHMELVYKFYLYDESFTNELDSLIGPNRDDTFIKRLNKLKNKQFPMLFKNRTKEMIDIDYENVYQNTCFKAKIFLPYKKNIQLKKINKDCIKGFYISYQDFCLLDEFKKYTYFVPTKNDWVSDVDVDSPWKEFEFIKSEIQYFLDLKKSPLVWLKNNDIYKYFFVTWW